jgi:AraC-like DNA-binding protein
LHQPLKVPEIARACGMSERNLRRKWKDWSARTLVQEIGYRRVERACQLLLLPDVAISRIAEEVGVADTAQFSRLFKGFKSISPGAFRRHHLAHVPDSASDQMPFLTEYQQ